MSIQLNFMEMLDALDELESPAAASFKKTAEGLASAMALEIARLTETKTDEAIHEGMAFAGLCAPFNPTKAYQAPPQVLTQFDPGGVEDWIEDAAALYTEAQEA